MKTQLTCIGLDGVGVIIAPTPFMAPPVRLTTVAATTTAFSNRAWVQAWVRTAAIGTLLLVAVFVGYDLLERMLLVRVFSAERLFAFHVYRGVGASVMLGSWAVYNVWRTRRQYDVAYSEAYRKLEAAMEERTRALVRTQAFTERLFDALRDRLVVLDSKGNIVKANRIALEALGGVDPRGRPCNQFGGACEKQCVAQIAFDTRQPVVGQAVRTDPKTGRIFNVDAYPVPDPDGGEPLIIEVARDVTEAKNLEAQLRYQEKLAALGVLAAGIAHDIGNPLASMSSELEMMERERDLGRVHESVTVLQSQVARITRTLREMNDFARRRGDEVTAVFVSVALEDAMRMVRHDPRARRLRLRVDASPGLPALRGVEDHLVMVLVNLMINAFDATPGEGTVVLRARLSDSSGVCIEVCDDGKGMSDEVRRRALEPLFTTKADGRGTGLGLSVSAEIVHAMGGKLSLESSLGHGTTVRLTFPDDSIAHKDHAHETAHV